MINGPFARLSCTCAVAASLLAAAQPAGCSKGDKVPTAAPSCAATVSKPLAFTVATAPGDASWAADNGLVMYVAAVDANNVVMWSDARAIVTPATTNDAYFAFSWPTLLEADKDYRLDYYLDMNRNGSCDVAGPDKVGSRAISTHAGSQDVVDECDGRRAVHVVLSNDAWFANPSAEACTALNDG